MPEVAAKLDDLRRSHESTKKLHDQLFDQYQKANLQIDIERLAARSRFEVVTAPFLMEPTLSKSFGIRGAIGMMLGLFLVALVHRRARGPQAVLAGDGRFGRHELIAIPV